MSDGNDFILGSRRGDRIDAGAGDDIVLGGGGRDVLDGGAGNDIVAGGRGNDVLIYRAAENSGDYDLYLGGRGCDTLVLVLTAAMAADAAVQAEIAAFEAYPAWAPFHFATLNLTVHSVENLYVRALPPETQAPVLTDDALTVEENGAARTIDLLANDSDPDGTTLTITSIDATGLRGELTDNGDGTITFAPGDAFDELDEGETAEQTIAYTVTDSNGETSTATLTITVEGTNDAPVVGTVDLGEIDEDASLTFTADDLIANASDVDDDIEADSVTSVSVNGVALEAVDGVFTFVPPADFSGAVTIDFTVSDGDATVASTATLAVLAVNDAPEAEDASAAVAEDAAVSGQLAATDVDSENLTYTLDAPVDGLTLAADGSYTFDAGGAAFQDLAAGEEREVTASFTVSDGDASDTGGLTVTVTGTNDAPEAVDASAAVDEDATVSGQLAATDVDSEDFTFTLDAPLAGLTLAADGSYTFDASDEAYRSLDEGDVLQVSASYTVSDGAATDGGTLTIDVTGRNEAPVAQDDTITIARGGTPIAQGAAFVVANTEDDEGDPAVTALADGSFVVAYEREVLVPADPNDPDGSREFSAEVFARRHDADGAPLGDEFRVNTITEGDQDEVDVVGLADGGFIVTWEGRNLDEAGELAVRAQRYEADGTPLGGEMRINKTVTADQPKVVQLTNGDVVFAWEENASGGVFGQVFTDDGTAVTSAFRLNPLDSVSDADDPQIAALTDGGFVAVWADDGPADPEVDANGEVIPGQAERDGLYGQRFDAAGNPVGPEFAVSEDPVGSNDEVDVAALSGGGFAVVWEGRVEPADSDFPSENLLLKVFDEQGQAIGETIVLDVEGDEPSITATPDGGFVVAWDDNTPGGALQAFDAGGNPVGERVEVAGSAYDQEIATLANGDLVVTWEDFDGVSSDDVFARVFTFDAPITEDAPATIEADRLLANDGDFEGDVFRISAVDATADTRGTVALQDDGSVLYDPNGAFEALNAGETATDTFSYTITDVNGLSDTATVTVEVQGVDDFGV